jgi:hypothetical protein
VRYIILEAARATSLFELSTQMLWSSTEWGNLNQLPFTSRCGDDAEKSQANLLSSRYLEPLKKFSIQLIKNYPSEELMLCWALQLGI